MPIPNSQKTQACDSIAAESSFDVMCADEDDHDGAIDDGANEMMRR